MYNGWKSGGRMTKEWVTNTQAFLDEVFEKVKSLLPIVWCPCSKCGNTHWHTKSEMTKGSRKTIQSGPTIVKPIVSETRP
jgi:hypothetical protein